MAATASRWEPHRGMPTYVSTAFKSVALGLAASVAMLAVGFGALLLFWGHAPHDSSVPGLFDYCAAIWGDGLFLSVGCGALVGWLCQRRADDRIGRRDFALAIGAGVAALLVGVVIQASWLASN